MLKSFLTALVLSLSMMSSQAGAMVFYPDPDPVVEFKYISPTSGKEYSHKVRRSVLTEVGLKAGDVATLDQILEMYRIQDRKEAEEAKMKK